MTPGEWLRVAALMRRLWPHSPIPEATVRAWGESVADLPADAVKAAVDAWHMDGNAWPPTGGQIRSTIAKRSIAAPDWTAAKVQLLEVRDHTPVKGWECPHSLCDGSTLLVDEATRTTRSCRCRRDRKQALIDRRLAALSHVHPTVAAFVEAVGIGELKDLDGDRTAEAQVRDKYRDFVSGEHRRITHKGLLAASTEGRLRQLDITRGLESGT